MPGRCVLVVVVVVVCVCLQTARGYRDGKVSRACVDMVPQHGQHSSPDPAPYNITVTKSTFRPGDNITVTLSVALVSGSAYFKGFLIEARAAGKAVGPWVGSFSLVSPELSQLLECAHTQGSAVSHTSDSKKTEVHAVWESPQNPPERVQFRVTVVHKFKEYWVQLPGPVVTLTGVTPAPVDPSTAPPGPPTTPPLLPSTLSSEGCGSSKSCLREPEGCDPGMEPGCFFLSFSTRGRTTLFELSAPAEGYVSFALSHDRWMGNDDVYLCVKDGERVDINAAYVSGRTHPEVVSEDVLRDRAWRLSDGVIQCHFRRDVIPPQQGGGRFGLDQSYFLFLAHGRARDGVVHRHDHQPLISTNQKVITGPPEDLIGSRSPLLIKFHGALMLVAWMVTVSTGILVARHFKVDWPEWTVCGQRVWFQVHRVLMTVSVMLTCVGFTLPFIYRGGWSKRAGRHPYLGCTVMALSVIQPIMGVLRPAPNSSRRYIFNWVHLGTGTLAQILAVVTMFLGAQQQALLLPGPWPTAVLSGWVGWLVLVHLILELHSRGYLTAVGRVTEDEEILLSQSEKLKKASQFKKTVLALFLLGNVSFLGILLKTIRNV